MVGVGGQGVLTAAQIIGEAALLAGQNVVVGQLHGMSQRGGSVESTVLLGPGNGGFIEPGDADIVLGLEPLETLRARNRMSARTVVIASTGRIVPPTLAQKGVGYPPVDEILAGIRSVAKEVITIDGPALVEKVGTTRVFNIILLGVLAGLEILPFDEQTLWAAIEKRSPGRWLEPNQRAFALGKEAS